jgi:hypothetical protein
MDLAPIGVWWGARTRGQNASNRFWMRVCDSRGRVSIQDVRGRSGVDAVTGAVDPSGDRLIDERSSARRGHIRRLRVAGSVHVVGHQLGGCGKARMCGDVPVEELRGVQHL